MRYQFYTCDVFTDKQFCGNQLAVLPDARGLSTKQMQQIAREFNFSESTFVFPPEDGGTRKVRIFTPVAEMPFAGHPNIGTACVLASIGALDDSSIASGIIFEEKAGPVLITFRSSDDEHLWCELKAPEKFSMGKIMPVEAVAVAVSLSPDDIVVNTHPPLITSVGLPFLMVELRDLEALERAAANIDGMKNLISLGITPDIHLYIHSDDNFDIRARMFAPLDGVPEDPATGSANCALAGLLAHCSEKDSSQFSWRVAQGVEMGRPSILEVRAEKQAGVVISVHIGGNCVMVSEGILTIEP